MLLLVEIVHTKLLNVVHMKTILRWCVGNNLSDITLWKGLNSVVKCFKYAFLGAVNFDYTYICKSCWLDVCHLSSDLMNTFLLFIEITLHHLYRFNVPIFRSASQKVFSFVPGKNKKVRVETEWKLGKY